MHKTRRQVLGTVAAGGAVGIAGCAGGNNGGGGGGLTNAFKGVEIDGDQLVVQLAGDTTSTVNVIGPRGTPSLGSKSVATGQTKVTFDLLTQYTPGEHEIVAVDSEDNQIGSTTQRLNPEVELVKVVTHYMQADAGWPAGYFTRGDALVTLKSSGNAPVYLSYILWDDVPNPTSFRQEMKNNPETVGLLNKDADPVKNILPGETITGVTGVSPFDLAISDFNCQTGHSTKVEIGYQNTQTFDVPVEYTTTDGECKAIVQN